MQLHISMYSWKLFIFEDFSISVSQRETKDHYRPSFRPWRKRKVKMKIKKIFGFPLAKHRCLKSKWL